jgi:hypothetical protein
LAGAEDPGRFVIEGIELAVATVEHHLGNQLARVVARCELLAGDPDVSEGTRRQAEGALRAALEAAETIARLRRLVRFDEDRTIEGVRLLDLGPPAPGAGAAEADRRSAQ